MIEFECKLCGERFADCEEFINHLRDYHRITYLSDDIVDYFLTDEAEEKVLSLLGGKAIEIRSLKLYANIHDLNCSGVATFSVYVYGTSGDYPGVLGQLLGVAQNAEKLGLRIDDVYISPADYVGLVGEIILTGNLKKLIMLAGGDSSGTV